MILLKFSASCGFFAAMVAHRFLFVVIVSVMFASSSTFALGRTLPFDTVFVGERKFERLLDQARRENWAELPIAARTARVGVALRGTPYKSYTLEIDDHIEAPSVNFNGMDCWTFFEISLAFARMLDEQPQKQNPQTMLEYIELDRYRGGDCDGSYLSRLHYLEDWLYDNDRRGLVDDLTRKLGGVPARHVAREMTAGWKHYRYLRNNRDLLAPLGSMERQVTARGMYHIPKSRVPGIESELRNGDIIGITSHDGRYIGTSHVGLAYRTRDGVLRFMHASSPRNYGKVVVDSRLSAYLNRFSSHAGILVARPIR